MIISQQTDTKLCDIPQTFLHWTKSIQTNTRHLPQHLLPPRMSYTKPESKARLMWLLFYIDMILDILQLDFFLIPRNIVWIYL